MPKAAPKPRGKVAVWVWVALGLVIVVGYWYGQRKGSAVSAASLEAAEAGVPLQPFTQPPFADYGASPYGTGFPTWSANPTGGGQSSSGGSGSGSGGAGSGGGTSGGQAVDGPRPRDPAGQTFPNTPTAPSGGGGQTYTVNYGTGDIPLPVGYTGYIRG